MCALPWGETRCPGCRYNIKVPRYSQMIAALTWMSHSQNLRRMAREHPIDLYMQPPVTRFRLLDYHLMDRIVRDSNRRAPPARLQDRAARAMRVSEQFLTCICFFRHAVAVSV